MHSSMSPKITETWGNPMQRNKMVEIMGLTGQKKKTGVPHFSPVLGEVGLEPSASA